jgi:hypothetical protein
LALNGKLDIETRDNLSKSHAASKVRVPYFYDPYSMLSVTTYRACFSRSTIYWCVGPDIPSCPGFLSLVALQDLTRVESGHETTFNEPFDLPLVITEATNLYKCEAQRKGLHFEIDLACDLHMVIGDSSKVRTVVANLTANACKRSSFLISSMRTMSPIVKYTQTGTITVSCRMFNEPEGLRNSKQVAIEISVGDTGCGIPANKLESIFREFEQVESAQTKTSTAAGLGLGLAVVARSVEQLGGQLRVDSKVDQGSKFSFLIPFTLWEESEQDLVEKKRNQFPGVLVEQERELSDHRAVSPNGEVSAISVEPGSNPAPSPRVADVDFADPKPGPWSSSVHSGNWEGTTSPSRSPGRGSGAKLRILSVEVGILCYYRPIFCTFLICGICPGQ